jgi:predicted enzyme related to lactoylglutathione lyase
MMKIAYAQFWVTDSDQALDFYVGTLGWEVREDVTMDEWQFRWLVVGPPRQEDVGLVLMPIPQMPRDEEAKAQVADLVAKGLANTLFLVTDDCQATYDELTARGVEFTDPPTQQPYGIDTGFRDPFGNNLRLTQLMEFSLDPR